MYLYSGKVFNNLFILTYISFLFLVICAKNIDLLLFYFHMTKNFKFTKSYFFIDVWQCQNRVYIKVYCSDG